MLIWHVALIAYLFTYCSQQVPGVTPSDSETNDITAFSAAWEHFSDYVNVDYDCINRTNLSVPTAILPLTYSLTQILTP